MNTSEAAQLMSVETPAKAPSAESGRVKGFSIDSRTTTPGELFFALSPEDYRRHGFNGNDFSDAHEFIPGAIAGGAVAVVARRERTENDERLRPFIGKLWLVEDVIEALQKLARAVLQAWGRKVIGITGSAGKTTTKDLTAHLLTASGFGVLKSKKNFNNELGLPLSILQMETGRAKPSDFDVAVLEMGMSSRHEIMRLCRVAPPDVAVELLVAPVHLEYMGSLENIAAAKRQLVEGLKPGGTAILNADDPMVASMRAKHNGPAISFGIENRADVMATNVHAVDLGRTTFILRTPGGSARTELWLPGRHNVMNALAASAAAATMGISVEQIAQALPTARPSEMRGEILRFAAGFTVVDDSYNSNPRSLLSMAEALTHQNEGLDNNGSAPPRRIVIAGEMLELGPEAARMHRETGGALAKMKIDLLWGVRGMARDLVYGAREAGMSESDTRFFENSEEAATAILQEVRFGDLILVKGSRGVKTERITSLLNENYRPLHRLQRTRKFDLTIGTQQDR